MWTAACSDTPESTGVSHGSRRRIPMASILLVDDDEVSRYVVRKMIERDGHKVEEAEDGEAALAAMDAGLLPDCIVLDLMMPRVGGVDVLRRMRSDARWQQIPV